MKPPVRSSSPVRGVGADAHKLLAEVPALEHPHEGGGGVFQPVLDGLAEAHLAFLDQRRDLGEEVGAAVPAVEDDEALDPQALAQDGGPDHRGGGRVLGAGIPGDHAAQGDAAEIGHVGKHRLQRLAADVLEIDVDAVGRGLGDRGGQLLAVERVVVEADVIAQLRRGIGAFLGAAGDADHAHALEFRQLPDQRADRPGRGRDHDRLARLCAGHVVQAHPCGRARHPQDAEIGRERRGAGGDLLDHRAVRDAVRSPAERRDHEVARREIGVVRDRDLGHHLRGHRLTDLDRLGVAFRRRHAAAHVGIERQPDRARKELALARVGDRALFQPEVFGARFRLGAACQHDALHFVGHLVSPLFVAGKVRTSPCRGKGAVTGSACRG